MPQPGISYVDWAKFNPDKLNDYLISGSLVRCGGYSIADAQLIDNKLYLTISAVVYVYNVDSAYRYLKDKFSITESEFASFPCFTDCRMHDGKMYTEEAWDYLQDPEAFAEEYDFFGDGYSDLNIVFLDDITLSPIPVADNALITLIDTDRMMGYHTTMHQFKDYLLSESENMSGRPLMTDVIFQYSDGQITAIAEAYIE